MSRTRFGSAGLVHSTIRAAAQVAAGQATAQVASGVVASLVQRLVWSMTMIKISSVAVGVILVGLTGYGVGLAAQRAGESRSVPTVAQIDGNQAGQDGGPGRGSTRDQQEVRPQGKPKAKTAGRARIYSNVAVCNDDPDDCSGRVDGQERGRHLRARLGVAPGPARSIKRSRLRVRRPTSRMPHSPARWPKSLLSNT